jgi:hypothetical protein
MPCLHRCVPWGLALAALGALSCSVSDPGLGPPATAARGTAAGDDAARRKPTAPSTNPHATGAVGEDVSGARCAPKPLWRFHAGSPLAGQPAIGKAGYICVATTEGLVHLLDPTGGFQWSYTLPFAIAAGPALSILKNCYVGTVGRRFYALSPRGEMRWERRRMPRAASDLVPRPGGGFAYLGAGSRAELHVFSAQGTDVWHSATGRGSAGPRWIDRSTAAVGTEDGRVILSRRSGVSQSQVGAVGAPVTTVVAHADGLYAVAGDSLVAFDRSLAERWRRPNVQFASPGPDEGGVVTVSADGLVTQFSAAGETLGTWNRGAGGAGGATGTGLAAAAENGAQPSSAAIVTRAGWVFVPRLDGRISLFPPSSTSSSAPVTKAPLLTDRLANSGFQTPLHDVARGRVIFAADSGEIVAFPDRIDDPCKPKPLSPADIP